MSISCCDDESKYVKIGNCDGVVRWCAGRSVLRRWCSRFWLCSRTSSSKCSRCCRKRWPNAVFSTPPSAVTKRKHSERQSSWFSAEHCTRIMYVAVSGGSRDQRMWSSTCGWFINLPTSPRSCCGTTFAKCKKWFLNRIRQHLRLVCNKHLCKALLGWVWQIHNCTSANRLCEMTEITRWRWKHANYPTNVAGDTSYEVNQNAQNHINRCHKYTRC